MEVGSPAPTRCSVHVRFLAKAASTCATPDLHQSSLKECLQPGNARPMWLGQELILSPWMSVMRVMICLKSSELAHIKAPTTEKYLEGHRIEASTPPWPGGTLKTASFATAAGLAPMYTFAQLTEVLPLYTGCFDYAPPTLSKWHCPRCWADLSL